MASVERPDLSDSAAFITGTSRGIGKALALGLAEAGCDVVSTGKTVDDSDSDLEGTIHRTAEECAAKGVDTHAVQLDVRDAAAVEDAVQESIDELGEINIVINNASAIDLRPVANMPVDRFDLVAEVNVRGTYAVSRAFIDHLRGTEQDAWLLTNAPPVKSDRSPGSAAYAWSKLGMAYVTLSLAGELDADDVGCNCFWPVTAIDTRATRYFGLGTEDDWRSPEVLVDTVLAILGRDPATFTGNAVYDEDILREEGVSDFSSYNLTEGDPDPTSARMFGGDYERPP